jgi:acyl-CoA reductase-like NAD-dependent aldehyde dehydrogenase
LRPLHPGRAAGQGARHQAVRLAHQYVILSEARDLSVPQGRPPRIRLPRSIAIATETKPAPAAVWQARTYQQLINGDWQPSTTGEAFERKSPATGELVETIAWGAVEDARRAIDVARAAFDAGAWPSAPAKDRSTLLRKIATKMREEQQALGELLSREVGKPVRMAVAEVLQSAWVFDYYAALALDMKGEAITNFAADAVGMTVHEPVGVVGIITPWNFPISLVSWKLAPALAAGCTVVIKPSEFTAGISFELARIAHEAGAPNGVVNVVTGPGPVVGAELAASMKVDKVAFTGSTAVGKTIMKAAAANVKNVSLELGGKSPNIVFPDADIDHALRGALYGVYMNTGQVCQAGTRLFVHEAIKDEFLSRLLDMTKTTKVGDPNDTSTTMGPLINEAQLGKVLRYMEIGKEEGAALLCGGGRLTGESYDCGLYVQPTIFDGVRNDMQIAQDEIFGPVLSVISFSDTDEMLRQANDTIYGLAAAVWTKDLNTAFKVSKGLQSGTVWVNAYHSTSIVFMPYGGYKQSGTGREMGHQGLEEYLEMKAVQIKLN